jgi:hypothetical protein
VDLSNVVSHLHLIGLLVFIATFSFCFPGISWLPDTRQALEPLQVRDGYILKRVGLGRVMVINATSNNISVITWRSVLLVEGTGVPRENHRPAGSHWQTLSHNVASSTPRLRVFQWLSYVTMVTIYNEPDISFTCKWPAVQKLHIYIWILFLNYDRSFVCFSNILTHKIIISVFNKAKQSIMQF